jgi:TonB family protein
MPLFLKPVAALSALGLAAMLAGGCQSSSDNYLTPKYSSKLSPSSRGGSEETTAKPSKKPKATTPSPKGEGTILLLVAHDDEGKVTAMEVRRSSGITELDAKAGESVLKKMRFPKGQSNTVLIPVDYKDGKLR